MLVYNREERLEDNLTKNYINRSRLYLASSLSLYKSYSNLQPMLKNIVVLGCGINKPQGLLLIVNVGSGFSSVLDLIKTLKENKEYIDDCIIDKNHHAIVLIPMFNIEHFIRGNYTDIYNEDQMKIFKGSEKVYPVVKKDKSYFPKFVQYMKSNYEVKGSSYIGENITAELLSDYQQYDIPPCLNQEIIWYKL